MSTTRHMIALLKSHIAGDDQEFRAVAMQAAAHEAKLGHSAIAMGRPCSKVPRLATHPIFGTASSRSSESPPERVIVHDEYHPAAAMTIAKAHRGKPVRG